MKVLSSLMKQVITWKKPLYDSKKTFSHLNLINQSDILKNISDNVEHDKQSCSCEFNTKYC